jgi:hypothetical protein
MRIGTPPSRAMRPHNAATWNKMVKLFDEQDGRARWEELIHVCLNHQSGTKADHGLPRRTIAERWLKYAAKRGWITE